MKLSIEIEMDSDSFVEDPGHELNRILRGVHLKFLRQLARADHVLCDAPEIDDKLLDINGNTVGKVRLIRD